MILWCHFFFFFFIFPLAVDTRGGFRSLIVTLPGYLIAFSSLLYLSHLMRLWLFSASVNSFLKRACAAIQWGSMSDFWTDSFVDFHSSSVRTAKALARLRGCAGSPEPSLVAYTISTIISWVGSFEVMSYMYIQHVSLCFNIAYIIRTSSLSFTVTCSVACKTNMFVFFWEWILQTETIDWKRFSNKTQCRNCILTICLPTKIRLSYWTHKSVVRNEILKLSKFLQCLCKT